MKKILLTIALILSFINTHSQDPEGDYNPYVNSGIISPSPLLPIEANGSGELSFNIGNTGSDALDIYTDQYIVLTITLSYGDPNNTDPIAAIGGPASSLFDWSYNSGTYTAVQNAQIPANYSGTITIDYLVTQNSSSPGYNGFNVNLAPAPYQTLSNSDNDDAVSSYTYTEIRDHGDAPSIYGSVDHTIDFTNYLGTVVDGESSDLSSSNADGDDIDGLDDEDGVSFPETMHREETVSIPVTVTGLGRLNVWFDWNGDGDFEDTDEQVASNILRIEGTENLDVTIPADAIISDSTFARFRLSSNQISSSTGSTDGGEVEDYKVGFFCAPPDAGLTISDSDSTFCSGTSISFTASGGANYEFRINGNSVQSGTSETFITTTITDGQYIDVIVTDDIGCAAKSDSIICSVLPLPTPTLSSSDDDNIFCDGSSILFTADGGDNYNFRINDISIQNGSNTTYATDSLNNNEIIDVIVTDSNGCSDTSTTITNTVNALPLIVITNPNSVCSPSTVDITASSITEGSADNLTYTYWTDEAATQNYSTPTTATDGTYYIMGTLPSTGCSNINSVNVTVNPTPETPIVAVTDNCDETSTLSTTAFGLLIWSTGETESSISVSTEGNYTVTTTIDGCTSAEGSGVASPHIAPTQPEISDTTLENSCPELSVDITTVITSSTPNGGSILYKTTNDPLGVDVLDPTSVEESTYYVFYQNSDGCYSEATEIIVAISNCPPDLTPTLIVNPNIMHGVTTFNLTVRITELNAMDTNGEIVINIPKDSRWILTDGFNQSLTIIGNTSLNNSDWSYSEDATNHIFTSSTVIPASNFSTFGFNVTFDPGSTRGIYTITSQVVSGGGGEVRVSNNADSESIDYFQE